MLKLCNYVYVVTHVCVHNDNDNDNNNNAIHIHQRNNIFVGTITTNVYDYKLKNQNIKKKYFFLSERYLKLKYTTLTLISFNN